MIDQREVALRITDQPQAFRLVTQRGRFQARKLKTLRRLASHLIEETQLRVKSKEESSTGLLRKRTLPSAQFSESLVIQSIVSQP